MRIKVIIFWMLAGRLVFGQAGQINIPRIELMPAQPSPYEMRNWRQVAIQYDSFVYDLNKVGTHLPLCAINPAGVNYPAIQTFRLHTYVGTNSPFGNEAINVLPSLVGATLAGADKTDQYGRDWVFMSRDFYNKANGELLYLNAPGAKSGGDWWYDMMPNVYFYQLYDLYRNQDPELEQQYITIANRMTAAVKAMGGNEAPWQPAYMNYRAWRFETMEPNANGVPEPEAAGAFAWLLYNAWKETGDDQYRKAAEWSIEFLEGWNNNPSYELMLPYGTLTAAKMNAELGTRYNVEKFVNWSFNRGALRGWGTIVGTWGGFNVSGLVGEANDGGNDYAFQMNGVQHAAALVPMVRYDKRFARAIGKWVLNLANATRLFYPTYLPADKQDASSWSTTNDPQNVIGYEAMRQVWQGKSPFSTGDAVNGGWAATNLALYGTSSIGYLGAMLNLTNVEKILQIDVLKTDFFGSEAYPTYLYYNSYASPRSVQLQTGGTPVDVYDALTETFLFQNVTGIVPLNIPAGQAMLITLSPAGGTITYDGRKMLINGVVVDYQYGPDNTPRAPRIKGLGAVQQPVEVDASVQVMATVEDPDSELLTFQWTIEAGEITGDSAIIEYRAPQVPGAYSITCVVSDPEGLSDTASFKLEVVSEINEPPVIEEVRTNDPYTSVSGTIEIECIASDPDLDDLVYDWTTSDGLITGSGPVVDWEAPETEGIYNVTVTVSDPLGLAAEQTISLLVHSFDGQTPQVIAHYPMTGNADDVSGNALHGQVNGAQLTSDRFGDPQKAYRFPGGAQHISVANNPLLNVQDGLSVSAWFKASDLPDRESFILSHGSWQNRWKISVTPEKRLRWTVNTTNAVGDLDALAPLELDSFYHACVTYGDGLMILYLNGRMISFRALSGLIRTASVPFLIGQMLPGETTYNFNGVIDDVKLYHGVLSPEFIRILYESEFTAVQTPDAWLNSGLQITPNPGSAIIQLSSEHELGWVSLLDMSGKRIQTFHAGPVYTSSLDVSGIPAGVYMVLSESNDARRYTRLVKW